MSRPAPSGVSDSPDAVLTLAEAAERLGVHYMTAYRYVQLGRLDASKVGKSWTITEDAIESFSAPVDDEAIPTDDAVEQLLDSILAGDEEAAWAVVEPFARTQTGAETVHLKLLAPVMTTIGQRWADGELSIAAEHRASAVTRRLLGRVRPSFRTPGRRRGVVVVAGVSGDNHSIPVSMFADLIRASGCEVIDLGANTPVESLLEIADRFDGRLVMCLSASHPHAHDAATLATTALHEAHPDMTIMVGGASVTTPGEAAALGSTVAVSSDPVVAAASAAAIAASL